MHVRAINVKKGLIAAAVALLLLAGAGVAYATGSEDGSPGQGGAKDLEKAKSVALGHTNGRVTETEVGDEEGYYEVEVTRDDGSQVDVHLDKNFDVLGTSADNESPDDKDDGEDSEE